jgi:hypothetical protein
VCLFAAVGMVNVAAATTLPAPISKILGSGGAMMCLIILAWIAIHDSAITHSGDPDA